MSESLRWRKDPKATGLRRAVQGERGHTLWRGDEPVAFLSFDEQERRWHAWVTRDGSAPHARLKGRWALDDVESAKQAAVVAARTIGKLASRRD